MKKLFPILTVCSLLLTSCSAPGTPVMLPLQSFFNGANYSRPVQITAVHQWLTDYTNIYLGSFTTVTPTGGTNPVVNLRPNDYILTAPDVRVPLRFTVYATNAQPVFSVWQVRASDLLRCLALIKQNFIKCRTTRNL